MNGVELAQFVRIAWPHVALLIVSGADMPPAAMLPVGSIFLTKPYDPDHVVAHAKTLTAV
jgi:DNA-binding response OmpR family regulator